MTVSLVVVSHSAKLAEGVVELAGQMAQGKVAIAAAGGTSEGELGTSVDLITEALRQVAGPDGTPVHRIFHSQVSDLENRLCHSLPSSRPAAGG